MNKQSNIFLFSFLFVFSIFYLAYNSNIFQPLATNLKLPTSATQVASLEGIDSGLIGSWQFEEGSGTTVADSSGKSESGTLVNSPTWVAGKIGSGALSFDGVDDAILLPKKFNISVPFSVQAWFKTADEQGGIAMKYYNSSEFTYSMRIVGGKLEFGAEVVGYMNKFPTISAGKVNDNIWHHAVGVYDGSVISLYLDGALASTTPYVVTVKNYDGFDHAIGFEGYNITHPLNSGFLAGSIDDVRIYNRVLSPQEITDLYNFRPASAVAVSTPAPSPALTSTPTADISSKVLATTTTVVTPSPTTTPIVAKTLALVQPEIVALDKNLGPSIGNGDSVLHLGSNGYAMLANSSVSDLDYSKDFSVEAIADIPAYTAGGRWSDIVAKTQAPATAQAGYYIGLNQGHMETFGQSPFVKIGDGSNSITLATSDTYQGQTSIIMSWNVSSKTLSLFVNGAQVTSKSESNINPSSIKNSSDLQIGGSHGYGSFGRDILLVRLWNRELSASDVSALYNNFTGTGSHDVPGAVSKTNLKSEWLMKEISDSTGKVGTTHIVDTAGPNHLLLKNGATIYQGLGSLKADFPANGASGISPTVVLRASGGLSTLGANSARSLSYYFQVDESSSFNTANQKSPGWISGQGEWKPILKPSTTYYWRVKVKDSNSKESAFSTANSFATRSSRDWYVRPGVYTGSLSNDVPVPVSGTYSAQNGSSYGNAWNGIREIVWGENGVSAGDNLYVCGKHILKTTVNGFFTTYGTEYVKESGYSDAYPVTIRMDCSGDQGTVWGDWLDNRFQVSWSGPDANGVYSTSNLQYGASSQLVGDNLVRLDKETASTWSGHPGSSYSIPKTDTPWLSGMTYVKTVDGSNPAGKIYSGGSGYRFHLGRSSFIKFYKSNFYSTSLQGERIDGSKTSVPPPQHITIDSCNLRYADFLVALYKGYDYWTIRNSDLGYGANGIYSMFTNSLGQQNFGANYLTVSGNVIHDIGGVNFPHNDEHGIGVQGGQGHLIENNEIYNTGGTAIEFWTGWQPMKDVIIRNNFIHDIHVYASTAGSGIVVSGDNQASVVGLRTGYKIYNNIIMNTGLGAPATGQDWHGTGIGSNNKDPMEVYNNIMYNTRGGISVGVIQSASDGPESIQGAFYNNMIINPWGGADFIRMLGPAISATVDYNLYYPALGSAGVGKVTLWPKPATSDVHSVVADPKFVSSNPKTVADFKLQAGSLAINAGMFNSRSVSIGLSEYVQNNVSTLAFAGNTSTSVTVPASNLAVSTPTASPTPTVSPSSAGVNNKASQSVSNSAKKNVLTNSQSQNASYGSYSSTGSNGASNVAKTLSVNSYPNLSNKISSGTNIASKISSNPDLSLMPNGNIGDLQQIDTTLPVVPTWIEVLKSFMMQVVNQIKRGIGKTYDEVGGLF